MWRWSQIRVDRLLHFQVFSTYVEMILTQCDYCFAVVRILHVCGDDPKIPPTKSSFRKYSPRMWRWSYNRRNCLNFFHVFSTYVEMIPFSVVVSSLKSSILHVCGDDPKTYHQNLEQQLYSPRMWRWSLSLNNLISVCRVFSTYVEMILVHHTGSFQNKGILHVCGDDPRLGVFLLWKIMYSPRMWRWSYIK